MNSFTYLKDPDFKEGRFYIGASDIPVLAGLYKHWGETPYSLWEKKTGRADPFEGNERTKAGKELESIVLKRGLEALSYEFDETEFLISRLKKINTFGNLHSLTEFAHPERPYLKAHPDLIEIDQPFGLEAKAHGYFGAKRGDDINKGYDKDDMTANGIPASVYLQTQTQMLCSEIQPWYVPVQIDTGIYLLYGPIHPHIKTQEKILALAERFWYNLEHDTPPKPELWGDINKMFPGLKSDSKTVISGPELDKVVEMKAEAKKIRAKNKENKAKLDDIRNAIGLIIGENKYLEGSNGDSLASASRYPVFNLKGYKDMSEDLKDQLTKDGYISETQVDKLNF